MDFKNRIAPLVIALLIASGCSGGSPQVVSDDDRRSAFRPQVSSEISGDDIQGYGMKVLWSYHHPVSVEQAFVSGGNIYLVSSSGDQRHMLIKVDGDSGLPLWTYPLVRSMEFPPAVYRYPDQFRAANPDEIFFVENGSVICLDDQFGAKIYHIDCTFPISTGPVVSQDQIFLGGWNKRVYGIGKSDGLVDWTYLSGDPITAPPLLSGVRAYVGSEDGGMYALTQAAGYQQNRSWTFSTSGRVIATPIWYLDRLFFGSADYKVYCIEDVGNEPYLRWSYPTGAPVVDRLFPYREWVFAGVEDARHEGAVDYSVVALSAANGERKWQTPGITQVLSAFGGTLHALGEDGQLHGLRVSDGSEAWALDVSSFAEVLGPDPASENERRWQGRSILVGRDGLIQAIEPRR